MIWPNLRTGAPAAIATLAILWPRGTRSLAGGAAAGTSPGRISSTAITTLSSELRRRARGVLMVSIPSKWNILEHWGE